MTKAKRGETIELKSCDNPVKTEYELGQKLGVRGTPSIILESGGDDSWLRSPDPTGAATGGE